MLYTLLQEECQDIVCYLQANVPYDEVFELEEINNDFAKLLMWQVIGANDVTTSC